VKYYAVAEIEVLEPDWVQHYIDEVTPIVEGRGGRYLARTQRVQRIEGERALPQIVLIIEWPSKEGAETFYDSDEYRPHRDARRSGARNEFMLVAGEDMTGRAQLVA
jgi:uncharacterized protein (DUF1330 family)